MKQYNKQNEILKKHYEDYLSATQRTSDKTNYLKIKDIYKYEEFFKFEDLGINQHIN